jgi:hypothetical protein
MNALDANYLGLARERMSTKDRAETWKGGCQMLIEGKRMIAEKRKRCYSVSEGGEA